MPRGSAGHPTAAFFFIRLNGRSLPPRRLLGLAVVLPVVVAHPLSVSSPLCAFQERSRLCQPSSRELSLPSDTLSATATVPSSQKIVKGARLRCASASRSQSILPLFHPFYEPFHDPPPPSPSLSSPLSLWRSFRVLPSITVSPSSLPRTNRRSLRDRQLKPLLCPNASPHPTLLPSASPLRRQTQTSLGPNKIHLPSDLLLA